MLRFIFTLSIALIALVGCSSKEDQINAAIKHEIAVAEGRMKALEQGLKEGIIDNASKLKLYADQLKKLQPQNAELIDALALDTGTQGPMFKSLQQRFNEAKNNPELFSNSIERLNELNAIQEAANYSVYSDALSDTVNVLADMSGGKLARVNAISQNAEKKANNNSPYSAASQLIGNPNYGQWITGGDGLSFWEWYGIYALLDNVLDFDYKRCKRYGWGYSNCRNYSYGYWSNNRPYSYYHDYGRKRYTSPKQYRSQAKVETRAKKNFSSVSGSSFKSPYSKTRAGASKLSQASKRTTKTVAASSYSRNSSNSHRSGSSRRSRGVSRGK